MLNTIHQDHRNLITLLSVLNWKLEAIRAGETVRYSLIRDIIDYMETYARKHHHPKEELIYGYSKQFHPSDNIDYDRLDREHEHLAEVIEDISQKVEMILLDAVIPLEQFADVLEDYIKTQKEHLGYEESTVLPEIARTLTPDDWRNIEQQWQHGVADDPLFGREVAERYRELAEYINQSNF